MATVPLRPPATEAREEQPTHSVTTYSVTEGHEDQPTHSAVSHHVTGGRRQAASNCDAVTLSAVAATLQHGEQRTRRVVSDECNDRPRASSLPPDYDDGRSAQSLPPPPIAVIEPDEDTVSGPSTSDGTAGRALRATGQPTPMTSPAAAEAALDTGDVDHTALDTTSEMMSERWTGAQYSSKLADKNATSTTAEQLGEVERDAAELTCRRRPTSLSVPPSAALIHQVSALAAAEAQSPRLDSNEVGGDPAAGAAAVPISETVNGGAGRFVTFFNFAAKQQRPAVTSSSAADRRFKRAVRRERRATKTLAIVLGNSLTLRATATLLYTSL